MKTKLKKLSYIKRNKRYNKYRKFRYDYNIAIIRKRMGQFLEGLK